MRCSQLKAFDEGTFGNYIWHFSVYVEFCAKLGMHCFPLEPKKSALFVTFIDNGYINAGTKCNYHSSVQTIARLMGVNVPKHEFPDVLLVLRGIQKERKHILSNVKHAVMWASFLTSFYLMLRKSNVCHTSCTKPNYLLRKHLNVKAKHKLIHIFWTKMLQLGKKILEMPLLSVPCSLLCPVWVVKIC